MFRTFLLSPANSGGKRAQMLLSDRAGFDLARRVRSEGAPLGEVFTFLSGLYFRGKLAYAREFARPPRGAPGTWVITSNRGLMPVDTMVTFKELRAFAEVPIDLDDERYARPLIRAGEAIRQQYGTACEVVLLGSVATGKYVDCLLPLFGERLLFPSDFVGRGDMSRGGLMLRCVADRRELSYTSVSGAIRRGARPPKLERRILVPLRPS